MQEHGPSFLIWFGIVTFLWQQKKISSKISEFGELFFTIILSFNFEYIGFCGLRSIFINLFIFKFQPSSNSTRLAGIEKVSIFEFKKDWVPIVLSSEFDGITKDSSFLQHEKADRPILVRWCGTTNFWIGDSENAQSSIVLSSEFSGMWWLLLYSQGNWILF